MKISEEALRDFYARHDELVERTRCHMVDCVCDDCIELNALEDVELELEVEESEETEESES